MKVEFIPSIMIINILFKNILIEFDGKRLLLTLNMKHPVWYLLTLYKVKTRRFLKIRAVYTFHFEFVITRMARFCILDNLDNDKDGLEAQTILQYWKYGCTKVK